VSERFVVTRTRTTMVRRCPFCNKYIKDDLGRDINFIVHLGEPIRLHRTNREWREYLMMVRRA
jgi:hypothetical protein